MELKKANQMNDLGYPSIKVEGLKPLYDFLLVSWEFCQDFIKAGDYTLIRPDTHKKMHYTGTVLAIGPDCDPVFKVGDRVIFDQFSRFEKYWDEEYGRVALLQESQQGSLFAIIPKRILVEGSEPEFNYDV